MFRDHNFLKSSVHMREPSMATAPEYYKILIKNSVQIIWDVYRLRREKDVGMLSARSRLFASTVLSMLVRSGLEYTSSF